MIRSLYARLERERRGNVMVRLHNQASRGSVNLAEIDRRTRRLVLWGGIGREWGLALDEKECLLVDGERGETDEWWSEPSPVAFQRRLRLSLSRMSAGAFVLYGAVENRRVRIPLVLFSAAGIQRLGVALSSGNNQGVATARIAGSTVIAVSRGIW